MSSYLAQGAASHLQLMDEFIEVRFTGRGRTLFPQLLLCAFHLLAFPLSLAQEGVRGQCRRRRGNPTQLRPGILDLRAWTQLRHVDLTEMDKEALWGRVPVLARVLALRVRVV